MLFHFNIKHLIGKLNYELKMTKKSSRGQPRKSELETELEYWQKKNEATEIRQIEDYENKSKILKNMRSQESQLNTEIKIAQIKMKEKEQELKLKQLKVQERMRQKPRGKLQPIKGAR